MGDPCEFYLPALTALRGARHRCEDCEALGPRHGLPSEGVKRWCSGCATRHRGAEPMAVARDQQKIDAAAAARKKCYG